MPRAWAAALPDDETVDVLELSAVKGGMPGWCTAAIELAGPEIEVVCGGINTKRPTHAGIWRQGHLLHFGFEPSPSQLNATGRKLLLNGIDYIAGFVTDRPIVRVRTFIDPQGAQSSAGLLDYYLAAADVDVDTLANLFTQRWSKTIKALDPEAARHFARSRRGAVIREGAKFAFDDLALTHGLDLREAPSLTTITTEIDGPAGDSARSLLTQLLPEGPGLETTANNWRNWLRTRQRYLSHDPHALVFRIDPLAQWRRVASDGLRGVMRRDGQIEVGTEIRALATNVVAFHGGARALDDLRAFACRLGDVHYLWDRRGGVLRIENHGELQPGRRATPWKTIVFDALADRDVVEGGGPAPRPRISGRGMYRELVERIFLPLMLLDPGTSLESAGLDDDGNQRLAVRIAGRGIDPRKTHVLVVAPTGEVLAYDLGPSAASRTNVMKVTAKTRVGPLLLPSAFSLAGRRVREFVYQDLAWNPTVPERLAQPDERLLGKPR